MIRNHVPSKVLYHSINLGYYYMQEFCHNSELGGKYTYEHIVRYLGQGAFTEDTRALATVIEDEAKGAGRGWNGCHQTCTGTQATDDGQTGEEASDDS